MIYNGAIIGLGGMGSYHLDVMTGYERINVSGMFDVDPARRDFAKNKGIHVYGGNDEIFADDNVDFVLIATTNEVHAELAIEAMSRGKHVICEKPVTMTSSELERVMAAAEKYNKIFTVDQNRRTNKDFILMKRNVEAGIIGKPYVIESRVEGSRGMPKGWRTLKRLGGGMMLDWGVHLIDQIMYMIPQKVTNVFCKMYNIQYPEVEDNFSLTLTFESGLTAIIEVGTNNYITHPRWYVLGEKGTLQIDDWNCGGKIVRCIDTESVWADEIVYTKAGPTKTMAPRNKNSTEETVISEPLDALDSLTVVYDQFLDAISGKAPLTITAAQALRVMKVMEAAFESAEEKISVSVSI